MYFGLHVKYPLFLSDFNEPWIFWTAFWKKKSSNIKFHGNSYSGSQVVPCGLADGHTDMTKVIAASHNFANAPKNVSFSCLHIVINSYKTKCLPQSPILAIFNDVTLCNNSSDDVTSGRSNSHHVRVNESITSREIKGAAPAKWKAVNSHCPRISTTLQARSQHCE